MPFKLVSIETSQMILAKVSSIIIGASLLTLAVKRKRTKDGLFLGFDFSTQSFTTVIVNAYNVVVFHSQTKYEDAFPDLQTIHGVYRSRQNPNEVTAPSIMFVRALEAALEQIPLSLRRNVVAISGSAQQHGTVYWNDKAFSEPFNSTSLVETVEGWLAHKAGPIWMDSTTTPICEAVHRSMGADRVAELTGSRCFERFSGNQAIQVWLERGSFSRVSLISSALSSLLVGRFCPVDFNEASGTNLMDIRTCEWSSDMLFEYARLAGISVMSLRGLLGNINPVPSFTSLGLIDEYFSNKFGFERSPIIVAFSGDNGCTIAGLGLGSGDVAVSLGTSSTVLALTDHAKPNGSEGHVLRSSLDDQRFMLMACFKNGDLPRAKLANGDWNAFENLCDPSRLDVVTIAFPDAEITPTTSIGGVISFKLVNSTFQEVSFESLSPAEAITSTVLGQCLAMRYHAEKLGLSLARRVIATGGGAKSQKILQILANIFGCPVVISDLAGLNTAAFGAALRAKHGLAQIRRPVEFGDIVGVLETKQRTVPWTDHQRVSLLLSQYKDMERTVIERLR